MQASKLTRATTLRHRAAPEPIAAIRRDPLRPAELLLEGKPYIPVAARTISGAAPRVPGARPLADHDSPLLDPS